MKLKNKVAIITGASSGIGRAIAELFALEGAMIVVADLDETGGSETADIIREKGGYALYVKTDVSRAREVANMVDQVMEKHGRIDILVNNAGIEGKSALTADYPEDDWDRVLTINLKSVYLCSKYVIPEMFKNGQGVIVNLSSIAGLVAFAKSPAYAASKAGVIALTRAMAIEYAPNNIRANCICPGMIRTPMLERSTKGSLDAERKLIREEPLGRIGKPEEVAKAALYLASDDSSYVTGSALVVDGGWTIK
jgi:NAD(P)-dependent dehydrogenase (short-subunit alcohol dehydrogenase family)